MNRSPIYALLLATALPLAFTPLARAQSVGQVLGRALNQFLNPQNEAASEEELRSFSVFMRDHPEVARDLRERPERVNDRWYLDRHPELTDWLDQHTDAAGAFRNKPDEFMAEERHFQYYSQDFESHDNRRGEMAHFDWFLDSHPEIRSELMRQPELASRDFYLDHHPELREFLQRHPMVREQLRDNPQQFMDREARFAANRDNGRE